MGRSCVLSKLMILAVFLSLSAFARPAHQCYQYFSPISVKTRIPPRLQPLERLSAEIPIVKEQTVGYVNSIPGLHGGRLLILEKTGESWSSAYSSSENDLHFDPRMASSAFLPHVAQFFGYNKISETRITIPDAIEWNGAVKKLNQILKEKGEPEIKGGFYNTKSQIFSGLNYLSRYVKNRQIPAADEGELAVHDNIHKVSRLMAPESWEKRTHTRYEFFLDFYHYLKSKKLDALAEKMNESLTTELDNWQAKAIGTVFFKAQVEGRTEWHAFMTDKEFGESLESWDLRLKNPKIDLKKLLLDKADILVLQLQLQKYLLKRFGTIPKYPTQVDPNVASDYILDTDRKVILIEQVVEELLAP